MSNEYIIGSVIKGCEYLYIADHFRNYNKSIVYIARDDREIFNINNKLKWHLPNSNILKFRSWDNIPYDRVSPSKEIQSERVKTLYELTKNNNKYVLLTSVNAIIQKVINKSFVNNNVIEISNKTKINFNKLIKSLIELGYQKTSIVRDKSEFAIRGSLIDIFLVNRKYPIRIDFIDNNIDIINEFDPITQIKTNKTINNQILINSSSEIILNDSSISIFRKNFRSYFNDYRKSELYISVSQGVLPPGGEQCIPLFHRNLVSLFSYCINYDYIINHDFKEILKDRIESINDNYSARIESKDIFNLKPESLFYSYEEIIDSLVNKNIYKLINFSSNNVNKINLKLLPNLSSIKKEIDFNFLKNFFNINSKNKKIIICANSNGSIIRINKILVENLNIKIIKINNYLSINPNNSGIYITNLIIEESIEFNDFIFINEKTLFGFNFTSPQKNKANKEIFFEEFNKIIPGTILVHSEYGFCRFKDIQKLFLNNSFHDCVELQFANDQKLFLPIENINLVTRYNNDENSSVQLDLLGHSSWQRRKSEAKNRIKEFAFDLMNVAAKRFLSKSPSINIDNIIYDKFSSTFPYIETNDQLKAINDIIYDFKKKFPADRLIVGDVAYGKSEIIIRSIFLIAKSSYQSLVLVPTTLLALQHFKNFQKRFLPFGIKVQQLSRLVSLSKRKKIIQELKEGLVDVVIGTHTLLNDNLVINKLGLIVIDEEQHFGVKAKEKLKKLSAIAHIITLSATPIPRTLQLSLSGIRDLSLILTPPYERLSIRTYINPFDEITIKEAIKREILGRNGGVFIVAPRLKDIPFLENFVKKNLPDIKYCVAHGKLSPKILEERIDLFYNKKIPLLISTNIIESGLDLPEVNTIIIYKANFFGLSQLHQLRGRVGRSSKRGYAYLTYSKDMNLTDMSIKRLNIINTYDKLGSGFTIASNDMNIRGYGSLIGEAQSGFVKEVGTELYNQLLEEEIIIQKNRINKTKIKEKLFLPQIKIPESIFIPDNYINDLDLKISIYRRISSIDSKIEMEKLMTELIDRFGEFPFELENLFKLIEIKILCLEGNIELIDYGTKGLLISYYKNKPKNPEKIINLNMNNYKSNIKIRPDNKVFYDFKGDLHENKFNLIKKIIRLIS